MKLTWLFLPIICFATTLLAAETIDERARMPENGRLEVSNTAGSVTIVGWNRDEIEITGQLGSESDRLEFEVKGQNAYINIEHYRKSDDRDNKKHHRHSHGEAELHIRVPLSTRLIVNTVSADITVDKIESTQRLQSVSGEIETQLNGSEGVIKSVSGELDITANGKQQRLVATTVSGDIDINGVSGELLVNTVSGDLTIDATRFSRLDSHTVSGDVEVSGELDKGGAIEVETVNGDVELQLASLHDTEFHLETFNGDIDPVFEQKSRRKSRYAPGRVLRLTEGDGSSRIRIETLNGDIEIMATTSSRREPRIVRSDDDGRSYRPDEDED